MSHLTLAARLPWTELDSGNSEARLRPVAAWLGPRLPTLSPQTVLLESEGGGSFHSLTAVRVWLSVRPDPGIRGMFSSAVTETRAPEPVTGAVELDLPSGSVRLFLGLGPPW